MDIRTVSRLQGRNERLWQALLDRTGLFPDRDTDQTVLVFEGDALLAAGSRKGNLFKCIAVDPDHQGEDLTATVLSALRQEAFREGFRHLFLYTKPQNEFLFIPLFFYPVAKTADVLLMESVPGGIRQFVESLPVCHQTGPVGACVMNCDPFTLGHLHLIETAAKECSHVYVFVLSEDRGYFSGGHRLAMVKSGTAHLSNVTVLPTGPYLISAATFPTYFLKNRDRAEDIHCALDVAIFTRYFVPKLSISRRYVGEEPLSPMTERYNQILAQDLPKSGVALRVIPRLCKGENPVSASAVRALLSAGNSAQAEALLPQTTYSYLQTNGLI